MPHRRKLRAAVIGAGLLGIDLAERLTSSTTLTCALVAGRSSGTAGLRLAARMGCATSTDGIDAVTGSDIDVVFDASNAAAHPAHWADLAFAGVLLVDLTPSGGGTMVAPTVNGHRARSRPERVRIRERSKQARCARRRSVSARRLSGSSILPGISALLRAGDLAQEHLVPCPPTIDSVSVMSGLAGVFSGFKLPVLSAAAAAGVDPINVFVELGRRQAVAGQEDLIPEVIRTLMEVS